MTIEPGDSRILEGSPMWLDIFLSSCWCVSFMGCTPFGSCSFVLNFDVDTQEGEWGGRQKRERKLVPIHWFTFQMPSIAGSQEYKLVSCMGGRNSVTRLSSALCPRCISWIASTATKMQISTQMRCQGGRSRSPLAQPRSLQR